MHRRDFIKSSLLAPGLAPFLNAAPRRKPNILLIVADDLGYADLGVQGCKDVPTPNIDTIARNGVRFTSGYVSGPVCSPTRAGMATGRYQQRFGHEFNPRDAMIPEFGLSLKESTLANRMQAQGYVTGAFGKWHLGSKPEFHPLKRGFDEYFGFLGSHHSYLDALEDPRNPILRGLDPVDEKSYTTEAFAREAMSFMDRHQKDPYFVYLPFNAVHEPLQTTEKYASRFKSIQDEKRRTFAGMLSAMDDAVGRILAMLRDSKLEEDTLIFFLSDNGGITARNTSRNDPLRGGKGQVFEGGIRIPFMMQWKGHLPAGKVYENPVISLDILPTAVAAAGGTIPASAGIDGVNLLPYLTTNAKSVPHDKLYWRMGERWAIRQGDWKLAHQEKTGTLLFNLADDIGEQNDLLASRPDKVKELRAAYDAWNKDLMAPSWPGQGEQASAPKPAKRQ
jgi:arylsulfatase A-like enzyme